MGRMQPWVRLFSLGDFPARESVSGTAKRQTVISFKSGEIFKVASVAC